MAVNSQPQQYKIDFVSSDEQNGWSECLVNPQNHTTLYKTAKTYQETESMFYFLFIYLP